MMIICMFNVQTAVEKKPRLNLSGADVKTCSLSRRSRGKWEASDGEHVQG